MMGMNHWSIRRTVIHFMISLCFFHLSVLVFLFFRSDCPACFEQPKERQRIKLMMAKQEYIHPQVYANMLQSVDTTTAALSHINNTQIPSSSCIPSPCFSGSIRVFALCVLSLSSVLCL